MQVNENELIGCVSSFVVTAQVKQTSKNHYYMVIIRFCMIVILPVKKYISLLLKVIKIIVTLVSITHI